MNTLADREESELEAELRQKNTTSLLLVALLSTVLVPMFWGLDWLIMPAYAWGLGVIRLVPTLFAIWMLERIRANRAWVEAHVHVLGPATVLLVAASISVMCWVHNGFESQYYAGVCLTVLGSGTLFLWSWRMALRVYLVMYAVYMLPGLIGTIAIHDVATVINNQLFLIATIIIVVASQERRHRLERTEFITKRSLGETKASLETALTRLQGLDKAKSHFFNNITHELRTPLTMILSPLENILSGDLGRIEAGHVAALKLIWRNALKLLKLINDLLDLARMEDQRMVLRREPTDVGRLTKDILDHTAPLAARKQIDVSFEEHAPATGFCVDPSKIERVLVNIISNALKFTEAGGRVRVSVTGSGGFVRVAVSDTGVGIAPDKLGQVFERFSQGDASVTRRFGGTGIGLAFAREIVQLHGGDISVVSHVGAGSTFTVRLPRGVPDGVVAGDVITSKDGPIEWAQQLLDRVDFRFLDLDEVTERRVVERGDDRGKATKVLVVEDNVELLRFLHLQLQDQHAVYLARNGEAGLALAIRERPDVIVSDYMMDVMDGLTMVRELRALPETRDIPVILLTAERSVETRTQARGVGADIYLEKPFSPKELRAAVSSLLKRRGREVQQVLAAQTKSLESVSAGLAHEIRNPLTYIKNAVFVIAESVTSIQDALTSTTLESEQKAAVVGKALNRIERMRVTADRGVARVEEVLETVRRYAREGYPHSRAPVELDAMVRDVALLLRPKTDLKIDVRVEAGASGYAVDCVADELQQMVRNLVQNAVDASTDGGVVLVRTAPHLAGVHLEISDTGHGIPRELQSRIFTPFFSTKDPGQGMGLGLAIVEQVVREHGGNIALESVPEQGTTFRVWLPARLAVVQVRLELTP